ncbi:MAG: hypothetical protein HC840_05020 [Leptolyngbyaceae cyanobacterium RM2_2_4]|nr:hypothetical protein [Leptolyngbyaceae cyanobacterium RM2_2_4]
MKLVDFRQVAAYFKGLPHQQAAFEYLEQNCPDEIREKFTEIWRKPLQGSKILDYVPQPDVVTCQSAAIAKVLGRTDVMQIRKDLLQMGTPGDPKVMSRYLLLRCAYYSFTDKGSLSEAVEFLKKPNRAIITHGWFTRSGHVVTLAANHPQGFIVDDSWGDFDFEAWRYISDDGNNRTWAFAQVYAAVVASIGFEHAKNIYAARDVDMDYKNAWFHLIEN